MTKQSSVPCTMRSSVETPVYAYRARECATDGVTVAIRSTKKTAVRYHLCLFNNSCLSVQCKRSKPTVLYLQTVVHLHVLVTHWAVADSEWVMGTRPPTDMQYFLPVKITAMFGKLLRPGAIFDSSCKKSIWRPGLQWELAAFPHRSPPSWI